MGVRSGRQYLAGLREQEREVWLGGERVRDVTSHPGLKGGARAIASLYDLQCDPELRDQMTYTSPSSGDPVGLSFIIPRTREDLETPQCDDAELGARHLRHDGALARFYERDLTPPGPRAAEFFAQGRPEFGENMVPIFEYIRENDLTLTHSLINLQRSRTASGVFNLQQGTALEVVRETDAGIVVRGARILATLGPLADEIGVYSPRMGRHTRKPQPVRAELCDPVRHAGAQIPVPRQFRPGPLAFRPATRLAL